MPEAPPARKPLPVVPFLRIPDSGEPYLEAQRCQTCGALFLGARAVCSKCGTRDRFEARRLSNLGTLHVYSIVHRSFPGIETPYVSAVVDLEGGGTVKGNLIHVEPTPEKVRMGMPVEVIYRVAPQKDKEGNEYLAYYFQPRTR
jgi:uncharacterized OB-fold protein